MPRPAADNGVAFFDKAPLFIELQGLGSAPLHPLVVEPLGLAARHLQQAGHRFLAHRHQFGRGPEAATLVQVLNHGHCLRFRDFGVEQGGVAAFGELLVALGATEEPYLVLAIHFPHS